MILPLCFWTCLSLQMDCHQGNMPNFGQNGGPNGKLSLRCIADKCMPWTPDLEKAMGPIFPRKIRQIFKEHLRGFLEPRNPLDISGHIGTTYFWCHFLPPIQSKDVFSGFSNPLQAEKHWYQNVPQTFRQRPVEINGRLKIRPEGSKDPRVSWMFLDFSWIFV